MPFALCPDGGLPRLIRFVTLAGNIIATLDREKNLLQIDPDKYNRLTEMDQQALFKTHSTTTIMEEEGKKPW